MRQVLVYILLAVFGIGSVFAPIGGLSGNGYIAAVYNSCLAEDPDVSMGDLVFEHLLSLESVVEFLEHEEEDHEEERPISIPLQTVQQSPVVVIAPPISLPTPPVDHGVSSREHPVYQNSMKLSDYINEVFHPPMV